MEKVGGTYIINVCINNSRYLTRNKIDIIFKDIKLIIQEYGKSTGNCRKFKKLFMQTLFLNSARFLKKIIVFKHNITIILFQGDRNQTSGKL